MANQYWIGVDLGGTKILAGLLDDAFQVVGRSKLPTEAAKGPEAVFNQVRLAVEEVLQEANIPPAQVGGLGMCIPGQVDPVAKRCRWAPNLNWKDLDLNAGLPASWSWPCYFENDVKLGTYGEFTHGAARGARHVVGIFVGTGVGGGLILNGEIYNGFNFSAGEIGHIIVHWRKGTELEAVAGRAAMMRRAADLLEEAPKSIRKEWKGHDPATMKSSQLAAHFAKGDPIILQLVDDAARALGAAVGSVINLLSPEVIVLGGGVTGALGEPFLERIWEVAQKYALPRTTEGVRFVAAALGDDSGIYGAAAFARNKGGK
ncbi:MAG: ROK family protein [Planctomycetes bacterium]|nr:ROK family protein [Planctomycetota bacterium]